MNKPHVKVTFPISPRETNKAGASQNEKNLPLCGRSKVKTVVGRQRMIITGLLDFSRSMQTSSGG